MASNKAHPSLFLHSRIIDGMASMGSELPSVILEDPLTDIVGRKRLAVLMTLWTASRRRFSLSYQAHAADVRLLRSWNTAAEGFRMISSLNCANSRWSKTMGSWRVLNGRLHWTNPSAFNLNCVGLANDDGGGSVNSRSRARARFRACTCNSSS